MGIERAYDGTAGNERGLTIIELLLSLCISGLLFAGMLQTYRSAVGVSYDHSIRVGTQAQAQAVMQSMLSELRVLGNGVPFDQANFQLGEDTLSDTTVVEPIQVSTATEDYIAFRVNERGEVHMLTADFDPALTTLVALTDTAGLEVGDTVYLTNSVVAGDDGLHGVISAVNAGSVTLSNVVTSPGALFKTGSILERVPLVLYQSLPDDAGIVRDSGTGPVLLAENASFTLEYLDADGAPVELPLTQTKLLNDLRALRVTVRLTTTRTMKNGEPYQAVVMQTVGLRNLNYFF